MDASIFDEQITKLRCRDCGRQTPQRVAFLRKHGKFACPACGAANNVDMKKLLNELAQEKARRTGPSSAPKQR